MEEKQRKVVGRAWMIFYINGEGRRGLEREGFTMKCHLELAEKIRFAPLFFLKCSGLEEPLIFLYFV